MAEQRMGLDYFPMAVDMADDDKVFMLRSLYACSEPGGYDYQASYACYGRLVELMQELYKEGFCMALTDLKRFKLSQRFGLALVDFDVLVSRCVEVGLFDAAMYEGHGVLTSRGIQRRYFEATARRRGEMPAKLLPYVFPGCGKTVALPPGSEGTDSSDCGKTDCSDGACCSSGKPSSGTDCSNEYGSGGADCSNEDGSGGAADATLQQFRDKGKGRGKRKEKEEEEEEEDERSSSSARKDSGKALACLALLGSESQFYTDDGGHPHRTPWDALAARWSHATDGAPIDAFAREVAALCPAGCDCGPDRVSECYRLLSTALAKYDPSRSSNPMPLVKAVLRDRSL